jgi:hypothetical protein
MFRHRLAWFTEYAVWVEVTLKPFKARVIIRKLRLEVLKRVANHLLALSFWLFSRGHFLFS